MRKLEAMHGAGFFLAAVLAFAPLAGPALADSTVLVELTDHSDGSMTMTSAQSVKAGKVTFEATNKSNGLEHEFIVARLDVALEEVSLDESNRVKEAALEGVQELGDLEPGKSGTMTLDLEPGKYLLFCNLLGHYTAGMYHVLTVTP